MTTLNFPAAPSAGATHNAANGLQYTYDGVKWTSQGVFATGIKSVLKLDSIASQFNGSTTTFNLTVNSAGINPLDAESLTISLGGVLQEPSTAYTVNTASGTITFSSAPAAGTAFFGLIGGRVNSSELSNASITADKLANSSVTTAKLANSSVTTDKLADDSVTIQKIADNAVGISQIADNAVGINQLADNSVGINQLADNSVGINQLRDDSVGINQLRDDSVGVNQLANNSVTTAKLADSSVGSSQIASQAIFNSDINDNAAIAQSKLDIADATTSASGFMSGSDKTKLDNIETAATADQTASEIKTAYESNSDTNAFTDADHTKLDNIDVTNDKLSVDSNNKFVFTGTTGQYPTITINHSDNSVEGEVIRFERTDSNNARFHSLKAKSDSSTTDANYLSFHIHDRTSINSQVEQLKITPNSVKFSYAGVTKVKTSASGLQFNSGSALNLPTNSPINIGNNADLVLKHNGTNSVIKDNGVGMLQIQGSEIVIRNSTNDENIAIFKPEDGVTLYFDDSPKFETTSTGCSIAGNLNLPDSTSNAIGRLMLGTHEDMQVQHDGSGGFIGNFTGNLTVHSNALRFMNGAKTKSFITADNSQQVALYYNDVNRAQTTVQGFQIIGTANSDTANTGLNRTLDLRNNSLGNPAEAIRFSRTESTVRYHSLITSNSTNTADNFIKFNIHDGQGSPFTGQVTQLLIDDDKVSLSYDGTEKAVTSATGFDVTGKLTCTGDLELPDGADIKLGNGDFRIFHDDSNGLNYIQPHNNGPLIIKGSSGEIAKFVPGGEISLRHNTDVKLETTSSGITVTGSVTTQDMNMSNLNGTANEVDSTKGSWSIQEGADDLFLINRVNGKKYKFNLTEIN